MVKLKRLWLTGSMALSMSKSSSHWYGGDKIAYSVQVIKPVFWLSCTDVLYSVLLCWGIYTLVFKLLMLPKLVRYAMIGARAPRSIILLLQRQISFCIACRFVLLMMYSIFKSSIDFKIPYKDTINLDSIYLHFLCNKVDTDFLLLLVASHYLQLVRSCFLAWFVNK